MNRPALGGLLLLLPVVVGLYLVVRLLAGEADAPTVHEVSLEAAGLCAAATNFGASRGFAPGDYLRRAWLTNAFSFAVLTVMAGVDGAAEPLRSWLRGGLAAVATTSGVLALWIFGRALRASGLGDIVPARERRIGFAIAVCVAVAIAGVPAARSAAAVTAGSVAALTPLISSLGDIGGCIAVVPVVLMARALRGGLLTWVSGFLAASEVCWLLLDAQSTVADLIGGGFGERWFDCWVIAACTLSVAAAIAQRRILNVERRVFT